MLANLKRCIPPPAVIESVDVVLVKSMKSMFVSLVYDFPGIISHHLHFSIFADILCASLVFWKLPRSEFQGLTLS